MKPLLAHENATTWFDAFDESWLPRSLSEHVQIVRSGTATGLKIRGIVGSVRLQNQQTLQILPKAGDFNFIRMLTTCEGLYDELRREIQDVAAYAVSDQPVGARLVVGQFAVKLREIETLSLGFRRTRRTELSGFAKGRLDPIATAKRIAANLEKPAVVQIRERDYDTSINRVLGAAAQIAQSLLSPEDPIELTEVFSRWSARFGNQFDFTDLVSVDKEIAARQFGGSRGYYIAALSLAKILLWQSGISTERDVTVDAESTIIETSTLFERYLRKLLVDSYSPLGILVTKGAGLLETSLYIDGTARLIPDLVFSQEGKIGCIADAKYKEVDPGDHYQMACYLDRYRVRVGILLMPDFEKSDAKLIRHDIEDGRRVWVVRLPLKDLDATERAIAALLADLSVLGSFGRRQAAS